MSGELDQAQLLRLRQSLNQTLLDALVPGALLVGLVYGLLAPIYALNPPPKAGSFLVAAAMTTAVSLITLGLLWRRHPPRLKYAQILGALVLGAVLANNALFLSLFPEPIFAGTLVRGASRGGLVLPRLAVVHSICCSHHGCVLRDRLTRISR